MLYRTKHESGRTLYSSKPLLVTPAQAYSRPAEGKVWFSTTTSVWRIDELEKRRVRDWRRLLGETGHTGSRTGAMRKDHDSVFTGTVSIFPAPLVEWIILRYAGEPGGRILDAFAGGPPRGLVSAIMGYRYLGVELRQEQIDENKAVLSRVGVVADYVCGDGRYLDGLDTDFDCGITCPPYHDLEKYSDLPDDLSNMRSYEEFNAGIFFNALAYFDHLKPGAFLAYVVGNFRDKHGELIDFPGHTIASFKEAGFLFQQDIILSKNFGSAAKRSSNAWKGKKLVNIHERLLVFRKPE
jgi:hypothetical protein